MKRDSQELHKRVEKAVSLFKAGCNCSQSVAAAFADLYGITEEQMLRISASFGGGIGRMRETCGAACGLFMLAGLENGATDPSDREGKSANYALVQHLAEQFEEVNHSFNCAVLLGLQEKKHRDPEAAERTDDYYAARPCTRIVESAATIWANYLLNESQTKNKED